MPQTLGNRVRADLKVAPPREVMPAEAWHGEEARVARVYAERQRTRRYSWFDPAYVFTIQEREQRVLRWLRRRGVVSLSESRILEVGCGGGYWLCEFVKWGARPKNITGIDLLPERIDEATRRCPAGVQLERGNAARLNFPDRSFDLVLQSTVFTSVLNQDLRREMAKEMIRVVKKGGFILWYDFHVRNPHNPHVQPVRKTEIHRLFRGCRIHLRRITLAPPITRFLAPGSLLACHALSKIPWLCSHYLGLIEKTDS